MLLAAVIACLTGIKPDRPDEGRQQATLANPEGQQTGRYPDGAGGFPDAHAKRPRPLPANARSKAGALFSEWERNQPRIETADLRGWIASRVGSAHNLEFGGTSLPAKLDSLRVDGEVTSFGFEIINPPGRFQATLRDSGRLRAELLFEGESQAYAVDSEPDAEGWRLKPTDLSKLLCTPPGTIYGKQPISPPAPADPAGEAAKPAEPVAALPLLNSLPGATHVIYCDFDGEVVSHPKWAGGATINATAHPNSNDPVFISNVWKRVSEDFSPFAINVTTDRAVYDATPITRRVQCIITGTTTAAPGSGGVAYLGSFGDGTPCWTFNLSEYACADTISHEVGHTLGLGHDGRTIDGDTYYGGHGSGATSWAPIMGAPWSDDGSPSSLLEDVTQWSRGEYPDANNTQDDLAIITGASNGFGYRADDKGSTLATASNLRFVGDVVFDEGIIERNTDEDWLSFTTSGGPVTLDVAVTDVDSTRSPQPGANLAVALELLDSSGAPLQSSNPTSTLGASVSADLAAGSYFLKITGAGRGTTATGFTNYASLGQYVVTGVVPLEGVSTVSANPSTRLVPSEGGTFSFDANSNVTWTWAKDATWVTSGEASPQTGSQEFTYTVAENTTAASRTAKITLTASGGFTAIHQIQQQGTIIDDHANTTAGATLVEPNSTTAGSFEIAGDEDIFRIVIPEPGTLKVETSGSTDTYGYLLDSSGSTIAENNDSVGLNFRISHAVSTGTYYVRLRHYSSTSTGNYQLVSEFTPSSFLTVSQPSVTLPAEGGEFGFNVETTSFWTWSGDADWLTSSEVSGQSGSQLFEYTLLPNTAASERIATITLVAGALSATHTVTQAGASTDDHGGSIATATPISLDSTTGGVLEVSGDNDYFRIDVLSPGTLDIHTTGDTDTYGYLLDSAGTEIASNDDTVGLNFGIVRSVSPGTYYIRVRGYESSTGMYGLAVSASYSPRDLYTAATIAANLAGTDADPESIPYGDGVKNLLKYAFNMNLASADAGTIAAGTGTSGLPSVSLEGAGQTRTIRVEFLRRKNSGLLYSAKWSTTPDVQTGVAMDGTTMVTPIETLWERVVVTQSFDTSSNPRAFAAVEVVLP